MSVSATPDIVRTEPDIVGSRPAVTESVSNTESVTVTEAESVVARVRASDDDPPSYRALKTRWESEVGVLPFVAIADFKDHCGTVPKAWFDAAIDDTKKADHPSWAYCHGILKKCREEQRPPSSLRLKVAVTTQPRTSLRYEATS